MFVILLFVEEVKMKEIIIEAKDLTKKFKHQVAVSHVNLHVRKGEIYGLIGRNGAGKTTIMKMIVSLCNQSEGTIALFGSKNRHEFQRGLSRVGSMIENPVAYPNLSAKDNLKYYQIQLGGVGNQEIDDILKKVNLADTKNKKFKHFSLGMKQRLGLAIALLHHPDILILDEPINGLDPIAIMEFRELLKELNEKENITIIISSHILSELYQVSTNFGFIEKGTLIKEISKEQLDLECQNCIEFVVNDIERATIYLQTMEDLEFKVLPNQKIRIYNHLESSGDINKLFVTNDIEVQSMNIIESDLEEYFVNLIGGGH